MKGRYSIEIASRKVLYKLEMERKVTVIKGDSGTGKTSMIRLVSDYLDLGKDSGIIIKKSAEFGMKVFRNTTDWGTELTELHNAVVFIDEDVRFLYDRNFQIMFQTADCYAVIVSRSGMFQQLPYAINSVYEFRTHLDHKLHITQMYQIYHDAFHQTKAGCVITEDSNSGHEMMQYLYQCPVYSAGGNSNVIKSLISILPQYTLLYFVVDGAAFGGYIEPVLSLGMLKGNILWYMHLNPLSICCLRLLLFRSTCRMNWKIRGNIVIVYNMLHGKDIIQICYVKCVKNIMRFLTPKGS